METTSKLRIVLLGYGHLGLALLQGLLKQDACEVAGVFYWSGRPDSRYYREPREREFVEAVRHYGIPAIFCPGANSYEFIHQMRDLAPDVILIGSWGEILKSHVWKTAPWLTVNCHPSFLPKHRGANPYASVILQDESETGITFHLVSGRVDAGSILLQEKLPIQPDDTGETLRERSAMLAEDLVPELIDILSRYKQGEPLPAREQDEAQASHYAPLTPRDGQIDWNAPPDAIDRLLRALNPWVFPFSWLEGRQLVLFQQAGVRQCENAPPGTYPPGTVLSNRRGILSVATSAADRIVEIPRYQLYFWRFYLPVPLSRWLSAWLIRPGQRFHPPETLYYKPA